MPDQSQPEKGTLCITRKTGESVLIGQDIRIETEIVGCRVRLRITAPRSVRITREELTFRKP